MALSDRIALLRAGLLEQVAEPREIYSRPSTAYVAQFIGQTNLLRAEVSDGIAHAGIVVWRCFGPTGKLVYSLRPECIRLVAPGTPSITADVATARFRGRIHSQTFGGAMDFLEIDCGNAQLVRARIPAPGPLSGDHEFEFSSTDAVRVRDANEE